MHLLYSQCAYTFSCTYICVYIYMCMCPQGSASMCSYRFTASCNCKQNSCTKIQGLFSSEHDDRRGPTASWQWELPSTVENSKLLIQMQVSARPKGQHEVNRLMQLKSLQQCVHTIAQNVHPERSLVTSGNIASAFHMS